MGYKCLKCGNMDLTQYDNLNFYCDKCENNQQDLFKEYFENVKGGLD